MSRRDIFLPGHLLHAQGYDYDAKVLWDDLQRWYTDIGPDRKLAFLRELTTINYRQFEDLNDFIARAEWLQRRLTRLDIPVSDEMMKTRLWGGLAEHPSGTLSSLKMVNYDNGTLKQ